MRDIIGNEEKLQKERKLIQEFNKKYRILKDKMRQLKEISDEDSDTLDKIESILKEGEQISERLKMVNIEEMNAQEERKDEEMQKQDVIVQDLQNNQDILKQRGKELQDIHQISNQIKDMSNTMVQKLNEQGAILNDIESNVIETEDNAKKAKQVITKANEMSKGNRKRMICFIGIIVVAIGAIIAIVFALK